MDEGRHPFVKCSRLLMHASPRPPRPRATRSTAPSPRSRRPAVESPRLDAELLLAHALGVDARAAAAATPTCSSQGAAVRAFQDAVRRRAVEREPVAYIVGRRAFRRLELSVDRARADAAAGDRAARRGGARAGRGRARARLSAPAAARSRSRSRTSARTCSVSGSDIERGRARAVARANARAPGAGRAAGRTPTC